MATPSQSLTSHLPLHDTSEKDISRSRTTMSTALTPFPSSSHDGPEDGISLSMSLLPTEARARPPKHPQRKKNVVEQLRPSLFQLFGGKPTPASLETPPSLSTTSHRSLISDDIETDVHTITPPLTDFGLDSRVSADDDPLDPLAIPSSTDPDSPQSMINMVLEDIELLREANFLLKNDQITEKRTSMSTGTEALLSGGGISSGGGSKTKSRTNEGWKDEGRVPSLDDEVEDLLTRRLGAGPGLGVGMRVGRSRVEDEGEDERGGRDDDDEREGEEEEEEEEEIGEKDGKKVIVEEESDPEDVPAPVPVLAVPAVAAVAEPIGIPPIMKEKEDDKEEKEEDVDIGGMTLLALLGDEDKDEDEIDEEEEEEDDGLGLGLVFLDSQTESEAAPADEEDEDTQQRVPTDDVDSKNADHPPVADRRVDGPFANGFGFGFERRGGVDDSDTVAGLLLGEHPDPPMMPKFTTLDDLIQNERGLDGGPGLGLGPLRRDDAELSFSSALGDISDMIDEDQANSASLEGDDDDDDDDESGGGGGVRYSTLEELIFEPEEEIAPRHRERQRQQQRFRTRERGRGQARGGLTGVLQGQEEGGRKGKELGGFLTVRTQQHQQQQQQLGVGGEGFGLGFGGGGGLGGVDSDEIDLYLDPIPFVPPDASGISSQSLQQQQQQPDSELQARFRDSAGSRSDLSSASSPHSVGSWFRASASGSGSAGRHAPESASASSAVSPEEQERRRQVRERHRLRDLHARRARAWGYVGYSEHCESADEEDEMDEDFDEMMMGGRGRGRGRRGGHEEREIEMVELDEIVNRKLTFDDVLVKPPEEEDDEEKEGIQMSPIQTDFRAQIGGRRRKRTGSRRRPAGPAPVRITPEDIGDVVNPETQAGSIGLPDALSHYSSVVGGDSDPADGDALAFLGSNRGRGRGRVGLRKAPTDHVHDESLIFYAGEQGLLFLPFEEGICCYCSQVVGADPACMDKHYVEACPLLMVCEVCSWLVGIPHYEHHLAFECAGKDALLMCPKCMKVFQWMDYGEHERVCDGDERLPIRESNRCWMCSDDIPSGIQGWRKHLLEIGCPLTWRRSNMEVRRKRRESFGDDSSEQQLKTPPPTSLGQLDVDVNEEEGEEEEDGISESHEQHELGPPELEVTTEHAFVGISELRHLRAKIDSLFHSSIAGATPARSLQNQFLDAVSPSSREVPDSDDLEERELFPSDDEDEGEEDGDDMSRRTSRSVIPEDEEDDGDDDYDMPKWPRRTRSRFESGPSDLDAPSPSSASMSAESTPPHPRSRPRRRRRHHRNHPRHLRRRVESAGAVAGVSGDLPSLRRHLSQKFEEMERAVQNFSNIQPGTETEPETENVRGNESVHVDVDTDTDADVDPSSLLSDQELLNGLSLERIRQMEEHEKELLNYVERRKRQVEESRVRSILREADISRQEFLERVSTNPPSKTDTKPDETTWPSFSFSDAPSHLRPRSHSASDSYEFVRLQPRIPAEFHRYGGGSSSEDVLSLSSILPEEEVVGSRQAKRAVSHSLLAFQDFRKRLDDISKSVDHW